MEAWLALAGGVVLLAGTLVWIGRSRRLRRFEDWLGRFGAADIAYLGDSVLDEIEARIQRGQPVGRLPELYGELRARLDKIEGRRGDSAAVAAHRSDVTTRLAAPDLATIIARGDAVMDQALFRRAALSGARRAMLEPIRSELVAWAAERAK